MEIQSFTLTRIKLHAKSIKMWRFIAIQIKRDLKSHTDPFSGTENVSKIRMRMLRSISSFSKFFFNTLELLRETDFVV